MYATYSTILSNVGRYLGVTFLQVLFHSLKIEHCFINVNLKDHL